MKSLWMVLLVSGCLCGCTSPFKGTWYLVSDERGENTRMFLSILNTSPKTRTITRIILNKSDDDPSSAFTFDCSGCRVGPGEMLTRNLADFVPKNAWHCRIPVSISVSAEGDKARPIELTAGMPSFLPETWDHCPDATTK